MISSLSIRNYALIKELHIKPDAGLNIITGETGAGKSIILGAVGLLLGNRADTKMLLDHKEKCVVEGEFEIGKLNIESLFNNNDLDFDPNTIIRREISPAGKSRAFINDLPVTLDLLKKIGLRLIDIHSQNESIQLGERPRKLNIIDEFAQNVSLLEDFQRAFRVFIQNQKELEELILRDDSDRQDADYRKFLLEELVKSELKTGEQEALSAEISVLENAENIKLKLSQITAEFDGLDMSVNDRIKEAIQVLSKVSNFSNDLESLCGRFDAAAQEIFDVVSELQLAQDRIEHDPARIAEVNARLDLIYRLQQKHHVSNVNELLDIQSKLESESLGEINLKERIGQLKERLALHEKVMIAAAEKLSESRRDSIDILSHKLNELLSAVGMPEGRVELVYKRVEPWTMGIDEVEILFSANKGLAAEPISKVASGGEFSRLMFCIKYQLAAKTAMPTVIFDEIDTGVSGEIALKLASMMQQMAKSHQIISISHLPQVAAKGDTHYFVYKDSQAEKAQSLIKKLEGSDRLEEIAKMIAGDRPSDTARESARELISKT